MAWKLPAGRYTPEARAARAGMAVRTFELAVRPSAQVDEARAARAEFQLARGEAEAAATRTAVCVFCGARRPSTPFLTFREVTGRAHDRFYCGCRGWELDGLLTCDSGPESAY